MSHSGKTIFKNASFMLIAQVITWGISLVIAIFLPRYLGVEAIGQYYLALSLWAILAVLVGFGMDMMLVKEVARAPQRLPEMFGTIVFLRLLFWVVGFAFLLGYTGLIYSRQVFVLVVIFGFAQFFGQISLSLQAGLRGLERMGVISIITIVTKLAEAIAILVLVLLGYGLAEIASLTIASGLLSAVFLYFAIRHYSPIAFRINRSLARPILFASYPYLLASIFIILYQQVDIVVMSWLVDVHNIGLYSVASRLFGTLLFVPSVFAAAAYPTLSRLFQDNYPEFMQWVRRSFYWLLLVAVPLGLGLIVVGTPITLLLYGTEYTNSGPILGVLGFVLIFTYMTILFGQILVCLDRQRDLTVITAIAALATVPLDLIFIPLCLRFFNNPALAGAFSFAVTELGMLIAMIRLLPRGALGRQEARFAIRASLAGLGMLGAVWLVRNQFIIIPIVVGMVVYIGLVLLLRVLPRKEWVLLGNLGRQFFHRVRSRFLPVQPAESN